MHNAEGELRPNFRFAEQLVLLRISEKGLNSRLAEGEPTELRSARREYTVHFRPLLRSKNERKFLRSGKLASLNEPPPWFCVVEPRRGFRGFRSESETGTKFRIKV